jgi:hypothetical protein
VDNFVRGWCFLLASAVLAIALVRPTVAREPLSGPQVKRTERAVINVVSTTPAIEVHDVASRDAQVRILVEKTTPAVGVVILFAGGRGATMISPEGRIAQLAENFLIRSRQLFWAQGLTTVVFDAPSDNEDDLRWFHDSEAFAADVGAVIRHLRKELKLPIWLIGTSRGTVAVANAATRLRKDRPDGVVFSATLFESGRFSDVFEFELEKIALPVLIVHHREDACEVTPPGEVPAFRERLKAAKPLKVLWFEGGVPRGEPCRARHYHGFNAIEEQVIADVVAWIKLPAP